MPKSKPRTDWIGQTIGGRYEIKSLLGQGGMSTVYKATDPNLQRTVAIKLIHPHLSRESEFVRRFEYEAAAVAKLRHPGIMQVYDFNHDENAYYMVLEYIPGLDLKAKLKELSANSQQFSLDETVRIMGAICEAVAYAHEQGMIHRDLKPANVMLTPKGQPILTDFGVAKMLDGMDHTATGAIIGTAKYLSPEQAKGERPDERSDIYSLGVLLYEMVAGRPPFDADTTVAVLMKHVNEPVPDIRHIQSNVPDDLVRVIEKALAKDKKDRYQTAFQMAVALKSVDLYGGQAVGREAAKATVASTTLHELDSERAKTDESIRGRSRPISGSTARPASSGKFGLPLPLLVGGAVAALLLVLGIGAFLAFSLGSSSDEDGASEAVAAGEGVEQEVASAALSDSSNTTTGADIAPVDSVESQIPPSKGMIQIKSGAYFVGVDSGNTDHAPTQELELDSYWIDQHEVTNAEYAEFIAATGTSPPAGWPEGQMPVDEEQHPVKGVTWEQAANYCAWENKRLPTEAEWEVAARGTDGRLFPWGNNSRAVSLPRAGTYAVGSKATNQSPFGVFDMAGNVWEWVDEPYVSLDNEAFRVQRGGSNDFLKDMAFRLQGDPSIPTMIASAGIRCAADEAEVIGQQAAVNENILLEDSFADPSSGWPILAEGTFLFGYHPPDYYHVEVSTPEDYTTVTRSPDFEDVTVQSEVQVDHTETPDLDFRYGLVVRKVSEMEYYAFTVSSRSGEWSILKSTPAGLQVLDKGTVDTLQGFAPPGFTPNTSDLLRVDARGSDLVFHINNEVVSHIADPDYTSGEIGFFVQNFDETLSHVHYDALTIQKVDGTAIAEVPVKKVSVAVATDAIPINKGAGDATEADLEGMVEIPAGRFLMGSSIGEPIEAPEHEVFVDSFYLDKFEVTNAQYRECVGSGGCTQVEIEDSATIEGYRDNPEYDNYPIIGVTWDQAKAYCEWVDKRLPTEAEWEYAASGPRNLIYPWGNYFIAKFSTAGEDEVQPVDSYPGAVSPFGIFQMAGNVGEWVLDGYDENFYRNSPEENPLSTGDGDERIYRGGTFGSLNPEYYTTSHRFIEDRAATQVWIGFRCVRER